MACKEALLEAGADMDKAVELLRKKGLKVAEKKAARPTTEGKVGSYIHTGAKIGVLLELDTETDFAANSPEFEELLKDLCMQVAACEPLSISREDLPAEAVEKEKETFKALLEGKPERVQEQITQGKLEDFYAQVCLLDQPFIKDDSITVSDLIKSRIAKLGENIVVKRFVRFQVGGE
ncbi:MAG: elongation factor Ts [Planctomycetes bacterium DG_23]|nr:MAG: elongation factor Ts [Planctomycetes bacterium DG_23]